ncbi:hypothetical protein F2Q69_00048930 [Brassica cretica]|uniref:Uncharacterized protein n=1 Tax=Brassica cretica TaxID=69181 RepID=A0A8S9Q6T0_BRACR|nr:hypothetical protein F2Q69_00048930 [Brassica cretica]
MLQRYRSDCSRLSPPDLDSSLSPVTLPEINPFIKLRIEGIICIASTRGYGTLGVYSRGGTGSTGGVTGVGSVLADCSGSSSDKGSASDLGHMFFPDMVSDSRCSALYCS